MSTETLEFPSIPITESERLPERPITEQTKSVIETTITLTEGFIDATVTPVSSIFASWFVDADKTGGDVVLEDVQVRRRRSGVALRKALRHVEGLPSLPVNEAADNEMDRIVEARFAEADVELI